MSKRTCKAVADGIVRMKEGLLREQVAPSVFRPWCLFAIPIQLPEVTLASGFVLVWASGRERSTIAMADLAHHFFHDHVATAARVQFALAVFLFLGVENGIKHKTIVAVGAALQPA